MCSTPGPTERMSINVWFVHGYDKIWWSFLCLDNATAI